jgi:VWFA-related protein
MLLVPASGQRPPRPGVGLLAALLCAGAAGPLGAQQQDPLSFSAGVELVQVEVQVTADGQPVAGLGLDDFVLEENGQRQDINVVEFVGPHPGTAPLGGSPEPSDPLAELAATPAPEREVERYTWLYILPEVQEASELERIEDSLRTFIRRDLPPGFLVSLAGLPFTNDRQLLLASLDRMLGDSSKAIDPMLDLMGDLAFERSMATSLQRQNQAFPSFVGLARDPYRSAVAEGGVLGGRNRADDFAGLVSVERIDRQIIFYGRLALMRYLDLIEKMTALPGKKMVLLYRSGLRVEIEHGKIMEEIAAAALRHRVSVFTADPAGLRAASPFDVEDEQKFVLDWDARRRLSEPDAISRIVSEIEPRQGLVTLASTTGGRSLVDSNDLGSILGDVLEQSSNYYVLGYRPEDPEEAGRFRDVKVSVRRPGVKVRSTRGYYEAREFGDQSKEQKELALYRTLQGGSPGELKVRSDLSFFAAPGGKTATILSAAASPVDPERARSGFGATALLRIGNLVLFDSMPIYHEQSLRSSVDEEPDGEGGLGEISRVAYNARIDLAPGRYSLRLVVRDDESGEMGLLERSFRVPDLKGPSVPSSLLLTRRVQATGEPDSGSGGEGARHDALLDVGGLRPTPQASRVFRQGDVVHGVYHLYRPTEADLKAVERGLQLGLLRDGEWLKAGEVVAGGQAFPDQTNDRIGFVSWVDTSNLRPGKYTLLAILPNYGSRRVPHLREEFELLPRAATPVARLDSPR